MFKFKTSTQNNLYIVYRIIFPFRLEKIGSVSIVPERSYLFSVLTQKGINSEDLSRIQKRCRKLAKIEGANSYTEIS